MTHPANLHRLSEGYRYCTACGELAIEPTAKGYVTQCKDCYFALKDKPSDEQYKSGTCTDCGAPIESEVLESSRRVGRTLRDCQSCYRDSNAEKPSEKRAALIQSLSSPPTL